MDDAEVVRRLERLGQLPGDAERVGNRERPLREALLEREALDELHDDRAPVADLLEPVDVRDERMIERREHLGFAFEPRQPIRIVHDRVGKDLDRDLTVEPGITRAVDLAHATRAERADDFVGAEARAAGEWHGSGSALASSSHRTGGHFTGPR